MKFAGIFREHAREIALMRSLLSAQNAVNIDIDQGSLPVLPKHPSWIKRTFGIPHPRSCFAKRGKMWLENAVNVLDMTLPGPIG